MPAVGTGTWATFQGIPCRDVRFVRSRGYGADLSMVTVPAAAFDALDWLAPTGLDARPSSGDGSDPVFTDEPRAGAQPASTVRYEGTLVLSEDASHVVTIPGLVVVKIERAEFDEVSGQAFYRLTLADERLHWQQGVVDRWSYNVLRPDGSVRGDTLKPDGKRWRLSDVAFEVARGLWRSPQLEQAPAEWDVDEREVAFEPWSGATQALAKLIDLGEAEDPCLRLDGTLAIHRYGDGRVGWALGGSGPNAQPIPPAYVLSEQGTNPAKTAERPHAAEFMLFVGKATIATVAIDDWEPVIVVNGSPQLLSEELVRKLTGDKYGLAWLQKWVLLAGADQGAAGVDDAVLKVLREQAYRMWRLPGAETHRDGFYTGQPGNNAHLLPLQARAETAGGNRLPVTVEAFGWETARRKFEATVATAALIDVNERRQVLKTSSALSPEALRILNGNSVYIRGSDTLDSIGLGRISGLSLGDMLGAVGGSANLVGLNRGRVEYYLRELRRAELLKDASAEAASQLDKLLADEAKAVGDAGDGTDPEALALAKRLVEWERTAAESVGGSLSSADRRKRSLKNAFKRQFGELARDAAERAGARARQARRAYEARQATGQGPKQLEGPTFLKNKPRAVDSGATVVSAELGIVRTSSLAGTIAKEGAHDPAMTSLIPRPVRVLFGATLRPRIDQPPSGRPITGTSKESTLETPEQVKARRLVSGLAADLEARANDLVNGLASAFGFGEVDLQAVDPFLGGKDVVPAALSERETYYTAAFRRTGRGTVEQIDPAKLPLERTLRLPVRYRELVPLKGESNRKELDEESRRTAASLARQPEELRSESLAVAGPWPVQCDGVVSRVEIQMLKQSGAPCGFVTHVSVGGEATIPADTGATRLRGIDPQALEEAQRA